MVTKGMSLSLAIPIDDEMYTYEHTYMYIDA
jgi:hypothetical protein